LLLIKIILDDILSKQIVRVNSLNNPKFVLAYKSIRVKLIKQLAILNLKIIFDMLVFII
jgi:hydroxypyruvate isomerase